MNIYEEIARNKIFGVVRGKNASEAMAFAEGCMRGGLKLIEVTLSFPEAEAVISELSRRVGILVGAGTVLDADMAKEALRNGAKFLVSPHTDRDIINICRQNGVPCIQGAFTSSEIVNAWKLGVDAVKIFPASHAGGPLYIKAILEPLPFVNIMATGGINLDNFTDYLRAGTAAVGVASALIGRGGIDADIIEGNARLFSDKLAEFEKEGSPGA